MRGPVVAVEREWTFPAGAGFGVCDCAVTVGADGKGAALLLDTGQPGARTLDAIGEATKHLLQGYRIGLLRIYLADAARVVEPGPLDSTTRVVMHTHGAFVGLRPPISQREWAELAALTDALTNPNPRTLA